jgi:hypothetical protein
MLGQRRDRILKLETAEDRFTEIYHKNHWNDLESKSGSGSNMKNTAAIRAALPTLFKEYRVSVLLDVPCGDFNWMRHVVAETDIRYIGGDIVADLIDDNQKRYGSERVKFRKIDLTSDSLPSSDLLLCRDCWIHLSEKDILKVLERIISSEIPLTLTTSNRMPNGTRLANADIQTGDMRPLDLFSPPYSLDPGSVRVVDDYSFDDREKRCMVLLDQVEIRAMRDRLALHLETTLEKSPG